MTEEERRKKLVDQCIEEIEREYYIVHKDHWRAYFVRTVASLLLIGGVTVVAALGVVYGAGTYAAKSKIAEHVATAEEASKKAREDIGKILKQWQTRREVTVKSLRVEDQISAGEVAVQTLEVEDTLKAGDVSIEALEVNNTISVGDTARYCTISKDRMAMMFMGQTKILLNSGPSSSIRVGDPGKGPTAEMRAYEEQSYIEVLANDKNNANDRIGPVKRK